MSVVPPLLSLADVDPAAATAEDPSQAMLMGIVVVFGTALAAGWLMRQLKLPGILGFLAAGILVGPSGLALVRQEQVSSYAELGLVLLLFTVGLELSPAPLARMGRRLLLAAALQVVLTAVVAGLTVGAFLPVTRLGAALVGVAVSLSSTAIMVNHFSERGEGDTPVAAITTVISLLQDISAILLLVFLPLLHRDAGATWSQAAGSATVRIGALIGATLVARWAVPVLVERVFRHGGQELMTLFAIVVACVGAWLAGLAGWSWALGSFIAGLLLSQTDLRYRLRAEATPFRDVFNALFFVSIGMLVDLAVFRRQAGPVVALILATIVVKAVLGAAAVRMAGWPLRMALSAGLALATMSEFSYVLGLQGVARGLLSGDVLTLLIMWTVGTMLLGAMFLPLGGALAARLARRLASDRPGATPAPEDGGATLSNHVIIVGFGINGQNLARTLRAVRIPYAVIEMNPDTARAEHTPGAPVLVGDATRMTILHRAGLRTARALVIAIAEPRATRQIVAQAHAVRPDLYILARTRYVTDIEALYRLGARQVIPEEFETSIEIFAHVLKEFGVPDNVIEQQVTIVRAGHYGMLRGRPTDQAIRAEWLAVLEAAVTQTYLMQEGSPAVGQSLRDLDLRARTGVTIVAVTRGGKPVASPPAEFVLAPGDVLVLVGTHKALDQTRHVLDPPAQPIHAP